VQVRPFADDHDWLLCGDEYGRMKFGSAIYFDTDICNTQSLDFIGVAQCRKTYPLCNNRKQKKATSKDGF
jgi:hypothetical protein